MLLQPLADPYECPQQAHQRVSSVTSTCWFASTCEQRYEQQGQNPAKDSTKRSSDEGPSNRTNYGRNNKGRLRIPIWIQPHTNQSCVAAASCNMARTADCTDGGHFYLRKCG